MLRTSAVLWLFVFAPVTLAGSPRLVFERLVPAAHDLGGAGEIAIVQASGDAEELELFIEPFLAEVTQYRTLRAYDFRGGPERAAANVTVSSFDCWEIGRSAVGSARDDRGERVKKRLEWSDATCSGRIAIHSRAMKTVSSFPFRSEGTSTRVDKVTDDERRAAIRQAARYAAVYAAEQITPRRVREVIPLDESAPGFSEGLPLVESNRLAEARAVWERWLGRAPRSAALHYDLGALCEALGDREAAARHYGAAKALSPEEPRFSSGLKQFQARNGQ